MLKIKYIVIYILVFVISISCNKWLDIEPEDDLIKQEFWNTKEDVESCMAAAYDALRGSFMKSFIYGELRGDMVTFSGTADNLSNYNRIASNDITSTNTGPNITRL